MGRNLRITQEDVSAAADRIKATGEKPSARSIYSELGAGSMTTVLKYFQAWQISQPTGRADAIIPQSLQKMLASVIAQEVAMAVAAMEKELFNIRQANHDVVAESERQMLVIKHQGDLLERMHLEKAELLGRLAQQDENLENIQQETKTLRQNIEITKTERAKLAVRLEAMPVLKADLERLGKSLVTEQSLRVVAEQALAVAVAKLEMAEGRI